MLIEGKVLDNFNRGFVNVLLFPSRLDGEYSIDFLVDTGASATIISDLDAWKMGISYDELKPSRHTIYGFGEDVDAYDLGPCDLVFQMGKTSIIENLDNILVSKHKAQTIQKRKRLDEIPSLIGMDILKEYAIKYVKNKVVLER